MKVNVLVLLGPTASGKTRLGACLAKDFNGEVISADSRQVYRGMDIGTGKDLTDYRFGDRTVSYHMIDIVDPLSDFSVFDFQRRFFNCFAEITRRKALPILVGGTGLYLDAVLRGYRMYRVAENRSLREELEGEGMSALTERLRDLRPVQHNTTDSLDRGRLIRAIEIARGSLEGKRRGETTFPALHPFVVGLRWARPLLRQRISRRLKERLQAGMVDEVISLHESGVSWERLEYFGLEYRYIALYLQERVSYREMERQLTIKIHQFAKRQETWFRRMERMGTEIHWLENPSYRGLKGLVETVLS